MSRFDYVKYDDESLQFQADCKAAAINLETEIGHISNARWREAALMKLEEVYMCIGKGIRDDQLKNNRESPLQEERGNE